MKGASLFQSNITMAEVSPNIEHLSNIAIKHKHRVLVADKHQRHKVKIYPLNTTTFTGGQVAKFRLNDIVGSYDYIDLATLSLFGKHVVTNAGASTTAVFQNGAVSAYHRWRTISGTVEIEDIDHYNMMVNNHQKTVAIGSHHSDANGYLQCADPPVNTDDRYLDQNAAAAATVNGYYQVPIISLLTTLGMFPIKDLIESLVIEITFENDNVAIMSDHADGGTFAVSDLHMMVDAIKGYSGSSESRNQAHLFHGTTFRHDSTALGNAKTTLNYKFEQHYKSLRGCLNVIEVDAKRTSEADGERMVLSGYNATTSLQFDAGGLMYPLEPATSRIGTYSMMLDYINQFDSDGEMVHHRDTDILQFVGNSFYPAARFTVLGTEYTDNGETHISGINTEHSGVRLKWAGTSAAAQTWHMFCRYDVTIMIMNGLLTVDY